MDQGHLFVSPGHSSDFHHHESTQPPMPAMSHSASNPSTAQSPASDSPSSAVTPGTSAADLSLALGSQHQHQQHQHQQHAGSSGPVGQPHHQHPQCRPRNGYAEAGAAPQPQYTQLPPTSSLAQQGYSSAFSSITQSTAPQPHPVHPGNGLYQAPPQGHVPTSAQYRPHDQPPVLAPLQLTQLGVIGSQRPQPGFPYEFDPSDAGCRGLYSGDMDPSNAGPPAPLTTNGYLRHNGTIPVAPGHPQAQFAPHTQHPLDMATTAASNISLPVEMGGDQSGQGPSLHASAAQSSFGGSPVSSQPFMATLNFQHAQLHDYDSYSRPPKRTGRTAKPKRTPRPPNAFILYRKAKQAEVIRENPGVSNKDVSCIIGQMWKAEEPAVQDKYRELAEIEKKKHKEMHPNYKYQPRKPKNKRLQESQAAANAAAVAANNALLSGGAQDGGAFGGGLPVGPGGALPSGIKDSSVSSTSAGFSPYQKYHMMMHPGHGQTPQSVHSQQQQPPPHPMAQHPQQQIQSQAQHPMAQHPQAHLACGDDYYYRNAASIPEQHPHHPQQQPHAGGGFVGVPTQLDIKPSFIGGVPAATAAYWTPATPSDAAFSNTLPSGNVFHGGDQAAAAAAAAAAQMRPFDSVVQPHSAGAGHPSATPMFHPFDHQRQGQQPPGSHPSMHDGQGHADYQTSHAQQYHQHHAAAAQQQPPHSAPALGSYVNSNHGYHHPQPGMDALDGSAMGGADSQGLGLLSPPTVAWSTNM